MKQEKKKNKTELTKIGDIEIIGYSTSSFLNNLRNIADEYNQRNDGFFYWVINDKKENGYLLVRERNEHKKNNKIEFLNTISGTEILLEERK